MLDPRSMPAKELNDMGHEPTQNSKLIRLKCLDCCGDSSEEVLKCPVTKCVLWPYRTGKNPFNMRHNKPDDSTGVTNA